MVRFGRRQFGILVGFGLGRASAQGPAGPLIILIGAPGSGKSTIASMLSRQSGFTVVDAAKLAEENKAVLDKRRPAGLANMDRVEDPGMNALMRSVLEKADWSKGVILDGYPATKFQADFLTQLRKEGRIPAVRVIQLDAPDEVIRRRLAAGASAEQIEQRIKDYRRELENAALYYPEAQVVRIDSNRSPEATFADVRKALDAKR